MRRWAVIAGLCALACSKTPAMNADDLAGETKQLNSLRAEMTLFREMNARGQLTQHFAQGEAQSLQRSIDEHLQKLARASVVPGLEPELQRVQEGFVSLRERMRE